MLPCPWGSASQATHPSTHPKLFRPRGGGVSPCPLPPRGCLLDKPVSHLWIDGEVFLAPRRPRAGGGNARHGTARHTITSSSRSPRAKRRRSLRLRRRPGIQERFGAPSPAQPPPPPPLPAPRGVLLGGGILKKPGLGGWVARWVSEWKTSLPPLRPRVASFSFCKRYVWFYCFCLRKVGKPSRPGVQGLAQIPLGLRSGGGVDNPPGRLVRSQEALSLPEGSWTPQRYRTNRMAEEWGAMNENIG